DVEYPKAAAELSQILIGPVADLLGTRRLVIVADGPLQYLPFGALATPNSPGVSSFTPLLVEHEIVNLPSASTLAVIRREAPLQSKPDGTVAVFADPVFEVTDPRVLKPGVSAARQSPSAAPKRRADMAPSQAFRGEEFGTAVSLPRLASTRVEA